MAFDSLPRLKKRNSVRYNALVGFVKLDSFMIEH